MLTASDLSRPEMALVAHGLLARLVARKQQGPAEPALDAFIPELDQVASALGEHVGGKAAEDAKRRAALAKQDEADDEVDAWLKHHEAFLRIAGARRTGPHAAAAEAIHDAVFPDGLAHVDDPIPQENQLCRGAITILRAPEHAPTLAAIGLPSVWLDQWEAALDASDAAFAATQAAREAKRAHVGGGVDAEAEFGDLAVRLRRYIGSRASRKDKARIAEGRMLLEPLIAALEKAEKERAARETRKKKQAKPEAGTG